MSDPSKPPDPPEPTLEQLLALMHSTDREFCQSKDAPWAQREAIIDFHRRQWKETHKPIAESPPLAETGSKDMPLSVEDNLVTPHELQLPLEDALDPMRESPLRDKSSASELGQEPFEGKFYDIHPSQISSHATPPGEFDDIRPIGTFDTDEGGIAQPTAAPPGSEPSPPADSGMHQITDEFFHRRGRSGRGPGAFGPPNEPRPEQPEPNTLPPRVEFIVGLCLGFIPWGLSLIGIATNIYLGVVILAGSFGLMAHAFWIWAKIKKWKPASRVIAIVVTGLLSTWLVGGQVLKQYRQEKRSEQVTPVPIPTPAALSPSTASPASDNQRIFVDVSADYLVGLYKKYNSAQADEATKTYIGKWIKIPLAIVSDVNRDKHIGEPDTIQIAATVNAPNGWALYSVIATFSDQRWMDRALVLNKDEKVTIIGKIDRVIPPGIILQECELVEGKSDESR